MKIQNSFIFSLLILSIILSPVFGQNKLVINEIMAINNKILEDDDGDNSDWFEVYNNDTSSLNLAGYYLTDDSLNLYKWAFPPFALDSNEFIVIFASGKDRKVDKHALHTNFKLSGQGEYLALTNSTGTTLIYKYPEQTPDISYGNINGKFDFMQLATPGEVNKTEEYIAAPIFSIEHGYFFNPFSLDLSSLSDNTNIYYTTDASTPGLNNGILYDSPISISKSTIIRAVAIKNGTTVGVTKTQSYIFPENVPSQSNNQPGYTEYWYEPYSSSTSPEGFEYDSVPANYSMGDYASFIPGLNEVLKESLVSIPVVSIVSDIDNFFSHNPHPDSGGIYIFTGEPWGSSKYFNYFPGHGWRRPVSIEYFNSDKEDGNVDFQANGVIKLHGGATRQRYKTDKSSFSIGFTAEYGPTKIYEQIFGKGSPKQYDWLILRGGFDRRPCNQVRDPWVKASMQDMGNYASYNKFVHVYLNGLYWGMYNLSERLDENCMRDNLGGKSDDYDVIKDHFEVEHGDSIAWTKMVELANDINATPEKYQVILGNNPDGSNNPGLEKLLNPENLIDYILLNYYAGTNDWDDKNWVCARRKTNSEGFHFFPWDAEQALPASGRISSNNYNRPTGLFHDLLKYQGFKDLVVSRINKNLFESGAITAHKSVARYGEIYGNIDTAVVADQVRWGLTNINDIFNYTCNLNYQSGFQSAGEALFKNFINMDVYPEINVPTFNTNEIRLPEGFELTMNVPDSGIILYSVDGTDPGQYKLSENKSVMQYNYQSIPLPASGEKLTIKARIKMDTLWSSMITRTIIMVTPDNIEDLILSDNQVLIAPNPFFEKASVYFNTNEQADVKIQILNASGMYIETLHNGKLSEGKHKFTWNADEYPSGLYICLFQRKDKKGYQTARLIKK